MSDVIERLKEFSGVPRRDFCQLGATGAMLWDAIEEIERLRAIIVSDTHVLLSKRPVAFRVKALGPGWVLVEDEGEANKMAEPHGALVQGLYARDDK